MDKNRWGKAGSGESTEPSQKVTIVPLKRSGRGSARGGECSDYIEYIADMIHEMRWLAERNGSLTLAGLLDLAHKEACLEAARR